MEEFNYKLSQNNSILVLNGIDGLVLKIRQLKKSTNQNEYQKHYKYLREQCINGKHTVANTAMLGLIELTNGPDEIISLGALLKDMMNTIQNMQNLSGIIELVFYALFKSTFVSYDIMKNQHPLITILKKDQSCWPHIVCKIEDKFRSESKSKVLQRLQPFALYVLYDYDKKMDPLLQIEMLNIYRQYLDNITKQKIIILEQPYITRSVHYCKVMLQETPEMATYLISSIYQLILLDEDATEAIWTLHQYIMQQIPRNYSLEIVMISDCIAISPIMYLSTLCECLEEMLNAHNYPSIVTSTMKCSLLRWKMHYATASLLKTSDCEKIDALLLREYQNNDMAPLNFEFLDERAHLYMYMLNNEMNLEQVDVMFSAAPHIQSELFGIFLGCLYDDHETEISLKMLQLCVKCCEMKARHSARLLPVLLAKISSTSHADLHMELLRAIPKMGVLKENLATIVMTIKRISNVSVQMHAFAISLMYDLVLVSKICLPYLEELLLKESSSQERHELVATKTFVVMELCKSITTCGLENNRSFLAALVSKLLVRTNDNNLAITFAFKALKYLCQGMDPFSTYVNLNQRFEDDNRDRVIIGMCGIMSEIANVADLSDQHCETVIKKLFDYTLTFPRLPILEAAYKALSCFSIEQIALGFPSNYTNITNDNSILGSLAGVCWVNLLLYGPSAGRRAAADMIIKYINDYMKAYTRNFHEGTEGHTEPLYMALTRDNVLAAVAKYAKKNVTKMEKEVYVECLRILSVTYPRPMPPMDWSFLNELIADKDLLEYCITIASHQSSVSQSARHLIETHMKAIIQQNFLCEEVVYLYKNLEFLCNTIQPILMKPFLKKTLTLGLGSLGQSQKEIDVMLKKMRDVLRDPNVSGSNKASVAEVIMNIVENYEPQDIIFQEVLPTAGTVPLKYLNEYCPVHYKSITENIVLRCLSIRCAAAVAEEEQPFMMFDSIIDCRAFKTHNFPLVRFEDLLSRLAPVFHKHANHPKLAAWLNELMIKIEFELADRKDMRNVIFSCTVFIIAVVVASRYVILNRSVNTLEEFMEAFPFGMAHLLNSEPFAPYVGQFLESMYDFATNANHNRNTLSDVIARKFLNTLLLMRAHINFNDKFHWMKYIEVNF